MRCHIVITPEIICSYNPLELIMTCFLIMHQDGAQFLCSHATEAEMVCKFGNPHYRPIESTEHWGCPFCLGKHRLLSLLLLISLHCLKTCKGEVTCTKGTLYNGVELYGGISSGMKKLCLCWHGAVRGWYHFWFPNLTELVVSILCCMAVNVPLADRWICSDSSIW